ncbi:MAG TPA: type II toxin-antitoxin system Phd/YefM family antitoxin [Thermomicrobiales bacterium]|jgi:prevent-host-death family protein
MTKTISATEARIHFGDVLRGVTERGETIVVERSGKPQAVVLSVEEYERLRNGTNEEDDWWTLAERSRERFARELGDRPMPDIVQIINDSREERDAEILAAVLRR